MKRSVRGELMLLVTAMIWGMGFVSQGVGMSHVGAFTFHGVRSLVGTLALLTLMLFQRGRRGADAPRSGGKLLMAGLLCGAMMWAGSMLQMLGQQRTGSAGKTGFITALYILIVPLIGLLLGRRVRWLFWCSVGVACVGMYLLCVKDGFALDPGDLLVLGSAVAFAVQILLIGHFSPHVDGVQFSCLQMLTNLVLSAPFALALERASLPAIASAWMPVLYSGVLSSAVAFTLQILAQQRVNPVVASLIMSLESVFAAIGGWLVLGQGLSGRELMGCALVFAAVILAQLPAPRRSFLGKRSSDLERKQDFL